jgi:hypothetical protein
MAEIAVVHAVEHHFGDRLLAALAFAARLVIQRFGQALMLFQELVHHRVGGGFRHFGHRRHRDRHRHLVLVRVIGERGAHRGAGRGENDRHCGDKHAVGTRNRVIGCLRHGVTRFGS